MKEDLWFVFGGIYTDGTFSTMEEGSAEVHGPYATERDAERACNEFIRRNLDICWHKLWVAKVNQS